MGKPLYRQIADEIRAQILAGRYADGRIPTEGMLANRYRTTHVTVSKAMQILEEAGLIIRRAGSGTFVKPSSVSRPVLVSTLIAGLEDTEFFQTISAQIAESCRAYGLNLVWGVKSDFQVFAPGASIAHLVEHYRRQNICGVFFAPDAGSRDCRVTEKLPKADVGAIMDELMCRRPRNPPAKTY